MDLMAAITKEHSKQQALLVANWIGNDPVRFGNLWKLFTGDDYRMTQRAAGIVNSLVERYPQLITPYWDNIISLLKDSSLPIAVKRNLLRLLQFVSIPEPYHGDFIEFCFPNMEDSKATVAIRCFSMTILYNLTQNYHELEEALEQSIQYCLEQQEVTAGFRARAKHILTALLRRKSAHR
jgi:hypothetical protein